MTNPQTPLCKISNIVAPPCVKLPAEISPAVNQGSRCILFVHWSNVKFSFGKKYDFLSAPHIITISYTWIGKQFRGRP